MLLAVALVACLGRMFIRLYYKNRLYIDDGFLIFAAASICVGTGLLFFYMDKMYLVEAVIVGLPNPELPSEFFAEMLDFHKLAEISLVILWTAIFAVKFSFLFFFGALIDRVRFIKIYWCFAVTATLLAWVLGSVLFFVPCPYFNDSKALTCGQGNAFRLALATSIVMQVLNILTDMISMISPSQQFLNTNVLIVLVIPIYLTWRVQIKIGQKLSLLFFLCLSFVMILITIIRGAGIKVTGIDAIDVVWEVYWQFIEAAVAIIMVCLASVCVRQ